MLKQNIYTTGKLILQVFRTRQQNTAAYLSTVKPKHITFKETAIGFLEETLEKNVGLRQTPSKILKDMIPLEPVTTSININKAIENHHAKKEALSKLIDFIHKQHTYILIHTLNRIDTECCDLLDVMSYYDMFKLLLYFSKCIPGNIRTMNFYKEVMHLLRKEISNQVFSTEEIIFCIYFFGLTKINASNDVRITLQYLEFEKLSLYEVCIIAETAYKSGVKLLKPQIDYIEKLLESKANILVANTILLVPLCKVLRHVGFSLNFLPNNLNKEIVNRSEPFWFIPAVYILKLYKKIYLAEPAVLQRLVTDILAKISLANQKYKNNCSLYRSHIYEPKYIDRFLWSICMLNYRLTDVQLLEIRTFLDSMEYYLFLKPEKLLRILLSLSILGYRSESMIQKYIKNNAFLKVNNSRNWKFKISAQLLLNVIRIESPDINLHSGLFPDVYVKLHISKSLQILSEIVSGFSKKMEFQNVIINSPVEGIYIAGVSFDHPTSGSFHIDLLNEDRCLRFQKTPHGIMNLKLRLLRQLGYQSILIDEDVVQNTIVAIEYIEKVLYETVYAK